ncbi:MAG: hypothetical protein MI802_28355, partial [Desulfobacterales bacterium]|nr:hypothetical protein [Desulfobacterales bacterium]
YVDAMNLGSDTDEAKHRRKEAVLDLARQSYPSYAGHKALAQEHMQSGDIDGAVGVLRQMSKDLPMPYRLGDFDDKTRTFDVQYLDSPTGQFQPTGKMTLQEAMQRVNKVGEKQYANIIAMNILAIDKGNREKRLNPMFGKNANGDRFLIMPQKQLANPNQVEIEVRNEKTNEKIIFQSWEAMQDFGINIENQEHEEHLKDMEVKDQQIATSKAAMASHNRTNKGGKFEPIDMYDPHGNKVTAKNMLQYNLYGRKGYTLDNPDTGAEDKYDITMKQIDNILSKYNGRSDDMGNKIPPEVALEQAASSPDASPGTKKDWEKYTGLQRNAEEFYQGATQGPVGASPVNPTGKAKIDLAQFDGPASLSRSGDKKERFNSGNQEGKKNQNNDGAEGANPLPMVSGNSSFQASMDDLMRKSGATANPSIKEALKITKGTFNPEDKTITFVPTSENELKQVFRDLNKAGVYFDAKEGPGGKIIVSVVENEPNMVKS